MFHFTGRETEVQSSEKLCRAGNATQETLEARAKCCQLSSKSHQKHVSLLEGELPAP